MEKQTIIYQLHGISQYDGYRPKPIWPGEDFDSTYYDYLSDVKCRIPAKPIAELRKELDIH